MEFPAKWIFKTGLVAVGVGALVAFLSPSLRSSFTSGFEVRDLVRFRARFRPENVGKSCANFPLHRIGACVRSMIVGENRLHYASMTARIYYLSTLAEAAAASDEFARTRAEKVEARADLLEYLNDEMKMVLVQTGGNVNLKLLDGKASAEETYGDPETALRDRYYANLVDLWMKNWHKDEKYLAANPDLVTDSTLHGRLTVLKADRDELFSRFSIDMSRYKERRVPANADPAIIPEPTK